jgi:hypothetical protein
MRKTFKIAIAVASVLALAAVVSPAQASCGAPYQITSLQPDGIKSFVWTENVFTPNYNFYDQPTMYPGNPPVSPNFTGAFWAYGVGQANNSGAFGVENWFSYYALPSFQLYVGGEIFTTWAANSDIVGCLFNGGTTAGALDGQECSCVLLTDHDGTTGYYAALGNGIDANGNAFLGQAGTDGFGNGAPLILKPIPKPTITGSFRDPGTFNITLDVNVTGAPGDYLGTTGAACNCGVTGYKVLARTLTRGSAPPADRTAATWQALNLAGGAVQGVNPLGAPITVESLCGASNTDVYLATQLFFDSDFSTSVVSANSTRVECGPTIAEPQPIRPKVRPDNPQLRRNDRGTRGR